MPFEFSNSPAEMNSHNYIQIFIPLDDTSAILLENGVHPIPPKGGCFIPPRARHKRLTNQRHITINIPAFILSEPEISLIQEPIIVHASATSELLLDLIVNELSNHPNSETANILYYHLYNKMKAYYLEQTVSPVSRLYMHRYFENDLTISGLAALEGYSPSYFSSQFHKLTGYQPSLYLQLVRIGKAKEMLVTSNCDIKEISQMVGFNSHSAFTRAFSNKIGLTPGEYRAKYNQYMRRFETTCSIIVSKI